MTPTKLQFDSKRDFIKSIIDQVFLFKKTFSVKPGLYYTGDHYDITAPILVTCNYHLTVYKLWKTVNHLNTRILVIDTEGINVWCAAGKGKFCTAAIQEQLEKVDPNQLSVLEISKEHRLPLVIPKLALSGVKLKKLIDLNYQPIIGPIYMEEIPDFLHQKPLINCKTEKFEFDISDRLFTLPGSLLQFLLYSIYPAIPLFLLNAIFPNGCSNILWYQIPILFFSVATLYIIIFPYLPSRKFAIKGLTLASCLLLPILVVFFINPISIGSIYSSLSLVSIVLATGIFFGLYYTGNSGVSNYSLVKLEIVRYLPISAILYGLGLVMFILSIVFR